MLDKLRYNFLTVALLVSIFAVALLVRFSYFPQNTYFSFDQARDFYFAQDILKGDLRLIGPPSAASQSLFPGPLSLYVYALIQFFFGENPEIMSVFFRIYNAFGVFFVFLIGSTLFDKKVGFLSAALFAVSYEQSQYSLLMSHQPLAVLTVLLFYFSLSLLVFKKDNRGLVLTLLGLGLSIQFHFVYVFLIPIFLMIILLFKNSIKSLSLNSIFLSLTVFLLTVSSYIVSEFKFDFRMLKTLISGSSTLPFHIDAALYATNRFIHDSYSANNPLSLFFFGMILMIITYMVLKQNLRNKGIFLFIWILGGVLPYLISGTRGYYYSAGASVSLFLLFSVFVVHIYSKFRLLAVFLFLIVVFNNLTLIRNQNPKGPNLDIIIQPGMLLTNELGALDYIYTNAGGKEFAVRGLTVPLNINTTWSYLFEWYGQEKYGYVPIWAEKPAEGFPGGLPYEVSRSKLSQTQFVIIEPLDGVRAQDKENFFREEDYFTKVVEEKEFGNIKVEKRKKI